jgi:membrane associated rhomboid family serine protease
MFLPYGDTPNPPTTPYVNYLLIGINVAVFLFLSIPLSASRPDLHDPLLIDYLQAMGARGYVSAEQVLQRVSAYDLFVFRYGFRPAAASVVTLFTSMFLHGGWLHLAGNMLFLWIFGDNVEYRLGRLGYLLGYLATGAAATLFFALFVPGSQIPLVGASGAISGVLGCYFLWFPRNKVKTFVFLFPILMNTFYLPARLVLGFFLVIDNLVPFLINGGQGVGVAHGAHIGGFGAGLALAYGADLWLTRSRSPEGATPHRKEPATAGLPGSPAATREIIEHLGEGRIDRATALYLALPDRAGRLAVPDEGVLDMGAHLLEREMHVQALSLFRRFIAERPASPDIDRAYLGAGQAMLFQPRSQVSACQYFLAALDTARSPQTAAAAREYLRRLQQKKSQ